MKILHLVAELAIFTVWLSLLAVIGACYWLLGGLAHLVTGVERCDTCGAAAPRHAAWCGDAPGN